MELDQVIVPQQLLVTLIQVAVEAQLEDLVVMVEVLMAAQA